MLAWRFVLMACCLCLAPATAGAAEPPPPRSDAPSPVPTSLATALDAAGARQCLWVVVADPASISAQLIRLERGAEGWQPVLPPFPAVIGRRGLAPLGEKREGDGRTPTGIFPLGTAFGYASAPPAGIRWPYRAMTADDIWVDDPGAPDYITLTTRSRTSAASFEEMRRSDDLYKLGLVVAYNTDPVVKGHGSAIFIHLWGAERAGTAGCIALAEADLLRLLAWLDPTARTQVAILPSADRR
ncbi:MAG: hypothetical protein OZSIB_2572 [Candidatus Ozemobacter sibiricus]|uniref:L,D-TPase catalytic domain-containing protein n=1 Tax=Candidatus Ozemobacter sibiricus TaxID=2268124 RepID=A0A367Z811_9BACT|nr:MAG: hypothetical protein OZSIB_2572 [Candidatus Ozemobacter sibiricus]